MERGGLAAIFYQRPPADLVSEGEERPAYTVTRQPDASTGRKTPERRAEEAKAVTQSERMVVPVPVSLEGLQHARRHPSYSIGSGASDSTPTGGFLLL